MNKIFDALPDNIFDIRQSLIDDRKFGEPLDSILSKKFESVKEIYNFLDIRDELTDYLYEPDADGRMPFEGVFEFSTFNINEHRSKSNETLSQSAALIVSELYQETLLSQTAILIGVLHDCAKKYLIEVDKETGYLVGDLEKIDHITAYIGGAWARSLGYWGEELKLIIAVLFTRSKNRTWWMPRPEDKLGFYKELDDFFTGDSGYDRINMKDRYLFFAHALARAEAGADTVRRVSDKSVLQSICFGENVINNF